MGNKPLPFDKKKLEKNFNARLSAAKDALAKLEESGTSIVDSPAINQLRLRIKQLELSIRLIFDPNHINEKTDEIIILCAEQIKGLDLKQDAVQIEIREQKIKVLKRMKGCKKAPCFGRGYTAFNASLGEMTLCNCVHKNINIFI